MSGAAGSGGVYSKGPFLAVKEMKQQTIRGVGTLGTEGSYISGSMAQDKGNSRNQGL